MSKKMNMNDIPKIRIFAPTKAGCAKYLQELLDITRANKPTVGMGGAEYLSGVLMTCRHFGLIDNDGYACWSQRAEDEQLFREVAHIIVGEEEVVP